ncbi:MAG: HEAT repeat domain-containing protein [Gemmatimonadaceae bacterium]
MDYALTFTRHFSRLVWLLLNEGSAFDAQIATLRALVNAAREGPVTIGTRDWNLLVNDMVLPERFTGGQDLTAQLIGHSVIEIAAERAATPADLLAVACILATPPVPGDGGANVRSRLAATDVQTVRLRVQQPLIPHPMPNSVVAGGPPGSAARYMFDNGSKTREPVAGVGPVSMNGVRHSGGESVHDHPASSSDTGHSVDDIVREQDPDTMFRSFSVESQPKGSTVKLFAQLDAAKSPSALGRHLDALVHLANDSARKDRCDIVAEVIHGIVLREAALTDRTARRPYALAVRRLSTPGLLKCVTALMPRRRENYDEYMSVILRTEDAGAEAMVEALSAAPSIADRRMYFDAFLKLRTGVRTLTYMLGDDRWYVVRNAANLLGEIRAPEAEQALTRALDHEDDRARAAVAGALARLGTSSAAKALRSALRDVSPDVRERAAEALGTGPTRGKRSATVLINALEVEKDQHVQAAIIGALGQIATPDAIDKLMEIAGGESAVFKGRSVALRVAAVHALGYTQSQRTQAALQSLLRDKQKDVRGAASWFALAQRDPGNGG